MTLPLSQRSVRLRCATMMAPNDAADSKTAWRAAWPWTSTLFPTLCALYSSDRSAA